MDQAGRLKRKLPIGIQTFSEIRENQTYYYVDKTPLVYKLIDQGKYYFLSRPRRFGKSLLVDTLKALFEGNQSLFQGLFIEDRWDWSARYPVIVLDFGQGVVQSRAELDAHLRHVFQVFQQRLQVTCTENLSVADLFAELIRKAHERYGQRTVVLVDEYDKPLLDNIADKDAALAIREGLRNIYSVIKSSDAHIRFAFLTGVSKFSQVSLFSGLNNLEDITLSARYSTICGYTDQEVDTVFAPELEGLDREEIRRWYNGYNWLGEGVYNPFDLLLLFREHKFEPHWFKTSTPAFLVKLLSQRLFSTPKLTQLQTGPSLMDRFDVDNIATEALLFQTGYLTIHKVEQPILGHWVYTLGYPNREVESSLNEALLPIFGVELGPALENRQYLLKALISNDFDALHAHLQALFDSIPHDWYRNNRIAKYEGHYASIFYSHWAALGVEVKVEEVSNQGRVDMAIDFNGHIYLFEFKVVELEPKGKALAQLKSKNYAAKYKASGKLIHLIGVEFSRKKRNIVAFEVETI